MMPLMSISVLQWEIADYVLWLGFCFQVGALIQIPFFMVRGYIASYAQMNLDDDRFTQWKHVAGMMVETVRQECGWLWGFIVLNEILDSHVMAAEFLKMEEMFLRLETSQLQDTEYMAELATLSISSSDKRQPHT